MTMTEKKLYVVSHHEMEPAYRTRTIGIQPMTYGADYYKIGTANEPQKRCSQLSSGTPHVLRLDTTLESDDAETVEGLLHSALNYTRQTGEWFKLTSTTVNSLRALDRLDKEEARAVCTAMPDWLTETSLYIAVARWRQAHE